MTAPPSADAAAEVQCLFREINERLRDLNEAFELVSERHAVVCECAHVDCIDQLQVAPHEYETVRANGARFLVAPSEEHVFEEVEDVVGCHGRYYVVEKRGAAGSIARDRDPRG